MATEVASHDAHNGRRIKINELTDTILKLENKVNQRDKRINDLSENEAQLRTQLQSTTREKERLQEELNKALVEFGEKDATLKSREIDHRREMDTLISENRVLKTVNTRLSSEVKALRERVENFSNTLEKMRNDIAHTCSEFKAKLEGSRRDMSVDRNLERTLADDGLNSDVEFSREEDAATSLINSPVSEAAIDNLGDMENSDPSVIKNSQTQLSDKTPLQDEVGDTESSHHNEPTTPTTITPASKVGFTELDSSSRVTATPCPEDAKETDTESSCSDESAIPPHTSSRKTVTRPYHHLVQRESRISKSPTNRRRSAHISNRISINATPTPQKGQSNRGKKGKKAREDPLSHSESEDVDIASSPSPDVPADSGEEDHRNEGDVSMATSPNSDISAGVSSGEEDSIEVSTINPVDDDSVVQTPNTAHSCRSGTATAPSLVTALNGEVPDSEDDGEAITPPLVTALNDEVPDSEDDGETESDSVVHPGALLVSNIDESHPGGYGEREDELPTSCSANGPQAVTAQPWHDNNQTGLPSPGGAHKQDVGLEDISGRQPSNVTSSPPTQQRLGNPCFEVLESSNANFEENTPLLNCHGLRNEKQRGLAHSTEQPTTPAKISPQKRDGTKSIGKKYGSRKSMWMAQRRSRRSAPIATIDGRILLTSKSIDQGVATKEIQESYAVAQTRRKRIIPLKIKLATCCRNERDGECFDPYIINMRPHDLEECVLRVMDIAELPDLVKQITARIRRPGDNGVISLFDIEMASLTIHLDHVNSSAAATRPRSNTGGLLTDIIQTIDMQEKKYQSIQESVKLCRVYNEMIKYSGILIERCLMGEDKWKRVKRDYNYRPEKLRVWECIHSLLNDLDISGAMLGWHLPFALDLAMMSVDIEHFFNPATLPLRYDGLLEWATSAEFKAPYRSPSLGKRTALDEVIICLGGAKVQTGKGSETIQLKPSHILRALPYRESYSGCAPEVAALPTPITEHQMRHSNQGGQTVRSDSLQSSPCPERPLCDDSLIDDSANQTGSGDEALIPAHLGGTAMVLNKRKRKRIDRDPKSKRQRLGGEKLDQVSSMANGASANGASAILVAPKSIDDADAEELHNAGNCVDEPFGLGLVTKTPLSQSDEGELPATGCSSVLDNTNLGLDNGTLASPTPVQEGALHSSNTTPIFTTPIGHSASNQSNSEEHIFFNEAWFEPHDINSQFVGHLSPDGANSWNWLDDLVGSASPDYVL